MFVCCMRHILPREEHNNIMQSSNTRLVGVVLMAPGLSKDIRRLV